MVPISVSGPGKSLSISYLSSSHFKINWVPFIYIVRGLFPIWCFGLDPGVGESAQEPFKSMFFLSCNSLVFLDVMFVGFQSLTFTVLVFLVQDH